MPRSAGWLVALAATGAVVLGVLWWSTPSSPEEGAPRLPDPTDPLDAAREPSTSELRRATSPEGAEPERAASAGPTTVLFPLRLELELVQSSALPVVGGRSLDGGRRARIAGQIAGPRGEPVAATVHFVAGPNEGRSLTTDGTGSFGAHDLYPGVDVVEVRGPAILGSRREVRLANGSETLLNIGYGMVGRVEGRLVNEDGEPVVGASVRADGQPATSGENGYFSVPQVAPGPVMLEVEALGYAPHRQEIGVPVSGSIPASALEVRLARGATLELSLATDVGGPGPARVHIEPATTGFDRRFAWAAVPPVEIGLEPVTVADLPPVPVVLRVFRTGAVGRPPARSVVLSRGGTARVVLELEAAPRLSGQVVADGRAAVGARVRLSAADVPAALLDHGGDGRRFLDDEVRRLLPVAVDETVSDAAGRFEFTDHGGAAARLLEGWSADGTARGAVAVPPGSRDVTLELAPLGADAATLVIALPGTYQGLPVELFVAGAPRTPFVLPPREDLVIEGLERGIWRLAATWWGEPVLRLDRLEIADRARIQLQLPPGAILGQDEETWVRAGEEYPLR